MGWLSCFLGFFQKNISSQDLRYNVSDQETELAEAISRCEEHRRKKREEEEQIEIDKAIKESLKLDVVDDKTNLQEDTSQKQDSNDFMNKDSNEAETENNISVSRRVDEQLDKAVHIEQELPKSGIAASSPLRLCDSCNLVIEENGRSVNILGDSWHPECFCCLYCHKPISVHKIEDQVSNCRGNFHRSCYRRYCYICGKKFARGSKFNEHEFRKEMYCPVHEYDGTPKCCSCERLEPKGTSYVMFEDGRRRCVECMECAVMDTDECQHLHFDIREFFEGLNMKISREFPLLLVEKQALNKAEKEEKIENEEGMVTRGICLSEEQTVTIVSKGPRRGPDNKLIDMATESLRVVRECEVTAVLILYGLPRLLTGSILAHEMMHAWLRLNGFRNLKPELEEGLCQVLGHMWLDSQTFCNTDVGASDSIASSSSSSSYTIAASTSSKKGDQSDFERKFVEFCKYQIETDESKDYGDGFRKVDRMVRNSSLQEIIKKIKHGDQKLKNIQDSEPYKVLKSARYETNTAAIYI